MLLPIHIAAGGLAIVLGAVALLVTTGGTIHRGAGRLFVGAMLVMGFTASTMGFLKGPDDPNVAAGITVAYFVVTALMTVRVASILPEPFTTVPMRMLPILLVFVAMFYWLWRVRRRRALPVVVRNELQDGTAPS